MRNGNATYSRLFIGFAALLGALLMSALAIPARATASGCDPGDPWTARQYSDVVFIGEVSRITQDAVYAWAADGSRQYVAGVKETVTFRTKYTWKGAQLASREVVNDQSLAPGYGQGDTQLMFQVGATYVVYANLDKSDNKLHTLHDNCSRTDWIRTAGYDLLAMGLRRNQDDDVLPINGHLPQAGRAMPIEPWGAALALGLAGLGLSIRKIETRIEQNAKRHV